VLVGVVAMAGLAAFLDIRPYQPWILWLTAGLAALATDGVVRSHPRWDEPGPIASVIFLFLPAVAVLAGGLFIDHAVDGYARPVLGLVVGGCVGAIALGEYLTVDPESRTYGATRLVLTVATYLAAFAMYAVLFTNGLPLWASVVSAGAVSMALAMELLREARHFGESSTLVGLAIGVSLAELRLALYFFPLDGLLAGALLIIGFYLATGLVHHLLDHDLELATAAEYLLVAAAGTAAVVVTRVVV
jgi:hypothetical protein